MGNKNAKNFEYDDFLKLTKQINKQELPSQQPLLQQYKCMIAHHKDKQIEGICVNETCKQHYRRTCFDCINERIHDRDHGKMAFIQNADQLENIIQEFKIFLKQQIDPFIFQIYFEQLEFCHEIDDTLAYIKFQELIKIQDEIQSFKQKLEKLDFKLYLQESSLGLFQYLRDYQNQIVIIYQQLNQYKQMKSEIKQQPKKFQQLHQHQVENNNDIQKIQQIKKNKMAIIDKIQQTNEFKNDKLMNDQKLFLIQNIEEINKTIDQEKKEILANNYLILFKLVPTDASYYFKKGLEIQSKKKYTEAIICLDYALKINPTNQQYHKQKVELTKHTQNEDLWFKKTSQVQSMNYIIICGFEQFTVMKRIQKKL